MFKVLALATAFFVSTNAWYQPEPESSSSTTYYEEDCENGYCEKRPPRRPKYCPPEIEKPIIEVTPDMPEMPVFRPIKVNFPKKRGPRFDREYFPDVKIEVPIPKPELPLKPCPRPPRRPKCPVKRDTISYDYDSYGNDW